MASTSASAAPSHAPIIDGMLRANDRKRWLACLFMPQAVREHVIALHAFSHEIARVRDVISEPQLGEIRLQWWREAIEGSREGEALLNPVAAALLNAMRICNLPQAPLLNLIEARRFDLYNDAMPDLATLEGYCGETHSALFALTARILETANGAEQADARILADACGHAGVAQAVTGMLYALPCHAARGQCFLPGDVLARHGALPQAAAAGLVSEPLLAAINEMRALAQIHFDKALAAIRQLPALHVSVFIALAAVPLELKALLRHAQDPFTPAAAPSQWRLQWAMWRFARQNAGK